jgi:hypothetical protein
MALQDAIARIQTLVAAVDGIRASPQYLPEAINIFPYSVCYAGNGSYDFGPSGVMKGLHNIILEIHVARKDLPRDTEKVMDYADSIPLAIMHDPTLGATVSTIGPITYTFGGMQYGDQLTLGFRFTISNVKLMTTI